MAHRRDGPPRVSRRAVLGLLLGGLAGCGSDGPGAGTTRTGTATTPDSVTPTVQTPTTADPTPTRSPTPSGPLSVSFVGYAVQRSAFYSRQPDFEVVWTAPDRQLLFVMLTVAGGEPVDLEVADFSLRVDDRTVGAADGVEGGDGETYYPRPDACDCEDRYETYVTFPLSAPLSPEALAVSWEGPTETVRWELPDGARTALAAPTTEWRLRSFDAPDSVGGDESFSVALEVENTGEAAGTFRGALNQTGPMHGVSARWKTRVGAGERLRREETIDVLAEIDSEVEEVRLRLRTVGGNADRTVRVE